MDIKEIIENTRDILNGIHVPVGLMEQIAVPVSHAVHNLEVVSGMLDNVPEIQIDPNDMQPDPETEEKAIREEDL